MSKRNSFSIQAEHGHSHIGRSGFDLSKSVKLTMDIGATQCVYIKPVMPSDHIKLNASYILRLAPLTNPIFENMTARMSFFWVPNRLIWDGWKSYIKASGVETTTVAPYFKLDNIEYDLLNVANALSWQDIWSGSFLDTIGFPIHKANNPDAISKVAGTAALSKKPFINTNKHIDAMPIAAINRAYIDHYLNNRFLDSDSLAESYKLTSGDNTSLINNIINCRYIYSTISPYSDSTFRNFPHLRNDDYFTAALKTTVLGGSVQYIPITLDGTGSVTTNIEGFYKDLHDVKLDGVALHALDYDVEEEPIQEDVGFYFKDGRLVYSSDDGENFSNIYHQHSFPASNITSRINVGSIYDLRLASRLQEWLEKNASFGNRYVDQILGHFGIRPDDAQVQISEFIGSTSSVIKVDEIASTTENSSVTLGELGGIGKTFNSGEDKYIFNRTFSEFGYIVGFMSIIPENAYADGLEKMWHVKSSREEYPFPEFADIGYQEITSNEIAFYPTGTTDFTFAYTERYAEYKTDVNRTLGLFRDPTAGLNSYTTTNFYEPNVSFNYSFLTDYSGVGKIFSGIDTPNNGIWADLYFDVQRVAPLPKSSIPNYL